MSEIYSSLAIEQPKREAYKHFDVLASLDWLRFDLTMDGEVRPETMQRVYDEELSYVAEGINRPLYTEFVLQEKNDELVYFSEGKWQPYLGLLLNGLTSARQEAAKDPRKAILVDRAQYDLMLGWNMQNLAPGESMAWYSEFPEEQTALYGEEFMGSLGFQPKRRMGFIHQAERNPDNSLTLRSQSVDNSSMEAFEAAMQTAIGNAKFTDIIEAYDDVLQSKTGQEHHAGRPRGEKAGEENAWDVIQKHRDLVDYYFDNLLALARSDKSSRPELEREKKRLTYGFWAALRERMDAAVAGFVTRPQISAERPALIHQEVTNAYSRLMMRGEILLGCGGSITPDELIMKTAAEDIYDIIFGEDSRKQSSENTMHCVNCPECDTYHEKVTKVNGRYRCKNNECKLS